MITTKIVAPVSGASSSGSGFSFSEGAPENFRNPDDSALSSDIMATMNTAAASNSTAENTLDFNGAIVWSPASTRTTRKIRVNCWIICNLDAGAGAGSNVKAGIKYSTNGIFGPYTTIIEFNNTTPGTSQGQGGFTTYTVDLAINQDPDAVVIQAYADANSGAGGTVGSYARIFASFGYVEDFEDAVDLILIRPTSTTETYQENSDVNNRLSYFALDTGNCRDGIDSSFTRLGIDALDFADGVDPVVVDLSFDLNFPYLATPGMIHAQVVCIWDADINFTGNESAKVEIKRKRNASEGFTGDSDPDAFLNAPSFGSYSRSKVTMIRDITSGFFTSDQVKIRDFLSILSTQIIFNWKGTNYSKIYEGWLEVRVNSSLISGMTGWEPV